jgi:putative transposase
MERFSIASLDPALLDTNSWQTVDLDRLEADVRALVQTRQRAIELVIRGESDAMIRSECSFSRQMAVYLLRRCLQIHPDGRVYGFRILLPHSRLAPYRRTAETHADHQFSKSGLSGAFSKLLREHPALQDLLDRHILKLKGLNHIYESRIQLKSLHKRFVDKCRELDLDVGRQYPFNTATMAHRSLSIYIHKTIRENIRRATAANFGSAAVKTFETGDGTNRPVFRPFQRVEIDAHKIDAIFTILIPSPFGNVIAKTIDRQWVITIQEVASGAILSYHRSYRAEINSDDVLEAVAKALRSWSPRGLRIPTLRYNERAGYPSNVDLRFLGACWDEYSVDGALAEICKRVTTKMKTVVGCEPITLLRRNPNDRPYIESFFGVLEENGFHRLPNTTGSGTTDSRRSNPERAAQKYQMQSEDLDELMEVMHANYNSTPKTSLGSRTPLEYLEYLCKSQGNWPRQADPDKVEKALTIRREVVVRGNIGQGRRPHINFGGAKYTSGILRHSVNLIGKTIVIEVPRDIRTVRAYSLDGAEFGPLSAAPPWNRTAHTLEVRRAVQSQIKSRMFHYIEGHDPVIDYLSYLEDSARKGKTVPPIYLALREMITRDWLACEKGASLLINGGDHSDSQESAKSQSKSVDPKYREINSQRLLRKVING